MGAISFSEIPDGLLVPGSYQEVDMSLAGGGSNKKIALLIGQMLDGGEAVEGQEYTLTYESRGKELFAEGSNLAILAEAFLKYNKYEEVRAIGLKDKSDGIQEVRTITFAIDSQETGTVPLYMDGRSAAFGIKATDDLATIRNSALAALNSMVNSPVDAAAGAEDGELVVTYNHKGEIGNGLDLRLSLYGEKVPSGLTVSFAQTTPGSGNPDVQTAIDGMQEIRYNYMLSTIHDATNIALLETELNRRYTALVQKGCRLFIALSGDKTALTTYADANRNNPHVSVLTRGENPESEAVWLGRGAAIIIRKLADDPSVNINGVCLNLIASVSYSLDDRQNLLEKGIATYTVGADGLAYVERQVTMYTQNKDGDRDTSYLDIQIPETIDSIREYIRTQCAKIYAGYKLAKTSENFGAGAKVMTPSLFRSFLLSTYKKDFIQDKQWCQDYATYSETLIVESSTTDGKTRIDYRHRPQLIGQFLIGAGVLQAQ